ncbi:MAG: hypothetical protein HKL80_09775 [Acidimicrobiales bacterium]|nr:hypothetical protein [Acidimicrobiales bacterium]
MLALFLIFLREGIEASMIVAILLAYLDSSGHRKYFKDIFLGVGAALVLAFGLGAAAYFFIGNYDGSRFQTIFETATYVLAVLLLTYMTFWMAKHARSLSSELRKKADDALGSSERFGLAGLAFQAVGREGLETVVFSLAIVFAMKDRSGEILGAGLGLAVSMVIAAAIYKFGKRINTKVLFGAVGWLLLLFASGLLSDAIENLQQLGWFPFFRETLWNTSGYLLESSAFGDVIHSFFGYAQQPTLGQVLGQVIFLVVTFGVIVRRSQRRTSLITTKLTNDGKDLETVNHI